MGRNFFDWTRLGFKDSPRENNIVIVRHAESLANTKGIYQGQTYDTGLSPLGKKQVKALTARLKGLGVTKVISSPLKRTLHTARTVAKEVGCGIELNRKIIETNHGVWEGKHKDWIRENYSDLYNMWLRKPSSVIFPGGEAFTDTVKRTLDFLENTAFEPNTVIVTHDNIIRIMISLIDNRDIDRMWEIPLETASLNFFEVKREGTKNMFRTLKLNEVAHLGGLRNDIRVHAL